MSAVLVGTLGLFALLSNPEPDVGQVVVAPTCSIELDFLESAKVSFLAGEVLVEAHSLGHDVFGLAASDHAGFVAAAVGVDIQS